MTWRSSEAGFSAAELLITLFIGAAFIGGAYQLYSIAIGDSGANRTQAIASNLAYTTMRSRSSQISNSTSTCTASTATPTPPAGISLPPPVTVTVAITCPYTTSSSVSEVSVTVSYGNPIKKITHSVYASAQ